MEDADKSVTDAKLTDEEKETLPVDPDSKVEDNGECQEDNNAEDKVTGVEDEKEITEQEKKEDPTTEAGTEQPENADVFPPANDDGTEVKDVEKTEGSIVASENQNTSEPLIENQVSKDGIGSERTASVSTMQMIPVISDSQIMEEDETTYQALRGKANTPASVYTELTEGRDTRTMSSISDVEYYERILNYRPSAGVRTQEAFYRKAVDLISARCTSSVKMVSTEPLMGVKDPPPGFGAPRVFYIHQRRPRPMTPLKVWRGYHGNVYFEPMRINQASMKEHTMEVTVPPINRCSEKLQTVISQTRWNPEHTLRYRQNRLLYTPIVQELPPHERYRNQRQPVLVFDKDAVQRDPEGQEILQTLESTGTLRIQTASDSQSFVDTNNSTSSLGRARSPGQKVDKSKVCKGSVARKLVMFRNLMIPLMQDQLGKCSPERSPVESNSEFQTRESPTKLPAIAAKGPRTPILRIK